jgi:hypothetical protein
VLTEAVALCLRRRNSVAPPGPAGSSANYREVNDIIEFIVASNQSELVISPPKSRLSDRHPAPADFGAI